MTIAPTIHTTRIGTLVDLLQERAERSALDAAYTFVSKRGRKEEHWSYEELAERAQAIAAELQARNLQGARALLLYPPGLEYIAAYFGCLYAGVIAVPAYPPQLNSPTERIQAIVEDAQAVIALTTETLREQVQSYFATVPGLRHVLCLATESCIDPAGWRAPTLDGSTIAFLQYTSGSTATPKGVMVTHDNLLHNLDVIRSAFDLSAASCGVIWLPPYHDMGLIGGILEPLYANIPVVLMSPMDFLKHPIVWLQTITRYRATVSGGPDFAYDLCVRRTTAEQRADLDLSSWDVAFDGAEPIHGRTLERFVNTFSSCGFRRQAFYPCYGLAESTLFVTGDEKTTPPRLRAFDADELEQNSAVPAPSGAPGTRTLVSCGRTWPGQEVLIVDADSLEVCQPGRIGEIWVAGASVARGYWKRVQATEETFHAYTSTGIGPMLRTGDLGFIEDGELFVTGRLKDLIIIDGRNHYPQDIEQTVVDSHPALEAGQCAAFSVEIEGRERLVIMARVRQRKLSDETNDALHGVETAIGRAVAAHHQIRPYRTVFLQSGRIPKTSSGKIRRHACRALFLQNEREGQQ